MNLGSHTNGTQVAGAMQCGLDTEDFAELNQLVGGSKATQLADMHTDVVDEPIGDQVYPLQRMVEQLTHGDGGGALLTDLGKPLGLLRGQSIFQEEHVVGLQLLGHADCQVERQTLMNIMHEHHVLACKVSVQMLEHFQLCISVSLGVKVVAVGSAVGLHDILLRGIAAVTAQLHTDVTVTLIHEFLNVLFYLVDGFAVGMTVNVSALTDFAAQHLVNRHVGHLTLDVPQGFVNTGNGVVQNGTVSPVGAAHHDLPDILDVVDAATHKQGLHVLLNGLSNCPPTLGEGCTADAVQAGLRGFHLDDHQVNAPRCGANGTDISDCYATHGLFTPF